MTRRRLAGLLLPIVLLAAGCTAGDPQPDPSEAPPPFAGCAALTGPPAGESAAPTGESVAPAGDSVAPTVGAAELPVLPSIELPCFTGGAPVAITAIHGPAVINLWASWCGPCRKELPAFQRLADRSAGQLHVVGVDVRDRRSAAISIAETYDLTFPTLYDPDEKLLNGLERNFVPMTLFIDVTGTLRHLDISGALDDAALTELVEQHLGVAVRP